jgi:hypothetical protein
LTDERLTYRTVEHLLALIPAFLDVALQSTRVKRFEKLKAAKQLGRYRHDGTPVIEFTAIL